MQLSNILLVFLGGGIGAACRYITTTLVGSRLGTAFPWGTLTVNVVGSFLMGFIMYHYILRSSVIPEHMRLLLTVGFLGGFTTFSSFSMETMTLLQANNITYALSNILANVILGLIACLLGLLAARAML